MKRSRRLHLLCALAATASLDAQPVTAPSLTRNEAFAKIQAEASSREVLERASDELEAKRFEAALARIDAIPADVRDSDPALLNARGAALVQLDRIDEASATFNQVLQIEPTFFPARFNVGEILFQQEKYAEAAAHFRAMMNDAGGNSLLKFKLYLSYLLAGEGSSADYALRNIRFPLDGPAWYFSRAALEASRGEKEKARDLAKSGTKLHADQANSYVESLEESGLLP